MAIRKASCYSKVRDVPYTRKSKKQKLSYIRSVPFSKVTKFRMGDLKGYKEDKYKTILTIRSKEFVQIRDSAMEAARQYFNRFLATEMGKEFYLEIRPYPHHVVRENKMLTGAGADRMSQGMQLSFGRSLNRSAMVQKEGIIFIIAVNGTKNEKAARKLIDSLKSKLPCKIRVDTEYKK